MLQLPPHPPSTTSSAAAVAAGRAPQSSRTSTWMVCSTTFSFSLALAAEGGPPISGSSSMLSSPSEPPCSLAKGLLLVVPCVAGDVCRKASACVCRTAKTHRKIPACTGARRTTPTQQQRAAHPAGRAACAAAGWGDPLVALQRLDHAGCPLAARVYALRCDGTRPAQQLLRLRHSSVCVASSAQAGAAVSSLPCIMRVVDGVAWCVNTLPAVRAERQRRRPCAWSARSAGCSDAACRIGLWAVQVTQ